MQADEQSADDLYFPPEPNDQASLYAPPSEGWHSVGDTDSMGSAGELVPPAQSRWGTATNLSLENYVENLLASEGVSHLRPLYMLPKSCIIFRNWAFSG